MGNQLERPCLLLKRNFLRDTTFNDEVVNAGNQFAMQEEQNYGMMSQQIAGGP
jgi:hypothetical protein